MDGDWLIRQRRMRRSHHHGSRSGWRSSVWRRRAELEARMALGVGSCSGGGGVWRGNGAPTVAELGAVGGACGTSACELGAEGGALTAVSSARGRSGHDGGGGGGRARREGGATRNRRSLAAAELGARQERWGMVEGASCAVWEEPWLSSSMVEERWRELGD